MIGSYNGQAKIEVNMIDEFAEREKYRVRNFGVSTSFKIHHIAINAEQGTKFILDGVEIVVPSTGVVEVCEEMTEIRSLMFQNAVNVNILYHF